MEINNYENLFFSHKGGAEAGDNGVLKKGGEEEGGRGGKEVKPKLM